MFDFRKLLAELQADWKIWSAGFS